jgi:hypothetical protein
MIIASCGKLPARCFLGKEMIGEKRDDDNIKQSNG